MDQYNKSERLDYFYENLRPAVMEDFERAFDGEKIDQTAFAIGYAGAMLAKSIQGLADAVRERNVDWS